MSTSDAQRLVTHFGRLYRVSIGEIYPPSWGRDTKLFAELLKSYPIEKIETLLNRYFGVKRKIYSIPFFKTDFGNLIQEEMRENPMLPAKIDDNENWRFE